VKTKGKSRRRARAVDLDVAGRRWLTLRAAAHYCSLCRATLMRLVEAGKLTAYRPGPGQTGVLIEKDELDKHIASSRCPKGPCTWKQAEEATC
jgi:excisionase family DNA binding protein